jgi:hypothetical protein
MLKRAHSSIAKILILSTLIACSSSQKSDVLTKSLERSSQGATDMETWVNRAQALAQSKELNSSNCVSEIQGILPGLDNLDPAPLNWVPANKDRINTDTGRWMQNLFNARATMRSRIDELAKGSNAGSCVKAIRKYLSYIRFGEELLLESMARFKIAPETDSEKAVGQDGDRDDRAFGGTFPATIHNPKFKTFDLKSGDIILERDNSSLNSQIARMGDTETTFNHIRIVGEDRHGKLWVIDATPADAVRILPVSTFVEDHVYSRMALYRSADHELARRAGKAIHDYLSNHKTSMRYDFFLDEKDSSAMYDAEVVQFAYAAASKGKFILPRYKTDLSRFGSISASTWIHNMGASNSHVFLVQDIDVDPRFALVIESRITEQTRDRRLDDAVLTSLYSWMLEKDYSFSVNAGEIVLPVFQSMTTKLFGSFDQIDDNMPIGLIKSSMEFQKAFEMIRENLAEVEKTYLNAKGHSMPFTMLLRVNEEFRERDCAKSRSASRNHGSRSDLSAYLHGIFESPKTCPLQ